MFVIGSFFPALFVDKVGRRKPMMWGSFGLGISMMMIAILLSFKGTDKQHATSSAAVAFFFTVWSRLTASSSEFLLTELLVHAHLRWKCQLHSMVLCP
jgi:MFS family permease